MQAEKAENMGAKAAKLEAACVAKRYRCGCEWRIDFEHVACGSEGIGHKKENCGCIKMNHGVLRCFAHESSLRRKRNLFSAALLAVLMAVMLFLK